MGEGGTQLLEKVLQVPINVIEDTKVNPEVAAIDFPEALQKLKDDPDNSLKNVNAITRLGSVIRNHRDFQLLFLKENLRYGEFSSTDQLVEVILQKHFGKKYHQIQRQQVEIQGYDTPQVMVTNTVNPSHLERLQNLLKGSISSSNENGNLEIKRTLPESDLPLNEVHSGDFVNLLKLIEDIDSIIENIENSNNILKPLELGFFKIMKELVTNDI